MNYFSTAGIVWIILPAPFKNIAVFIYLLPLLICYIRTSTNIQFHYVSMFLQHLLMFQLIGSPPKLNDVLNVVDNLFACELFYQIIIQ